jgi:hypothetical protein
VAAYVVWPGCRSAPAVAQSQQSECPRWIETGHANKQIDLDALDESSGLAWHASRPELLWTHNDSGGQPRLFGVSLSGEHRVTVKLPESVEHQDWEDLAVGECPGHPAEACIAIGDIGDNAENRNAVTVYWVTIPPAPDGNSGGDVATVASELRATWSIQYEDGPRNVEGMFVGPQGKTLWLVEKSVGGEAGVYKVRRTTGSATRTAKRQGGVEIGHMVPPGRMVTGATLLPQGRTVFLRTYLSVVVLAASGPTFESWFDARKQVLSTPTIWQSESIELVGHDRLAMTGEQVPAPLLITSIRDECRG